MRLHPLLSTIPIVALGLLGCGGGDDGQTKDDFISQADAICKDLRADGDELEKADPDTPAELVQFSERAKRFINDGLDRFKGIELPQDGADREGAQAYIAQLEKAGTAVEKLETDAGELQQAVQAKDREQVKSVGTELQKSAQEVKQAGDEADKLAKDYGMEDCGEED